MFGFFINIHSGGFINYGVWKQVKDILPIISVAFLAGMFVFGIDYTMKVNDYADLMRILIGGSVGLTAFTGLSWKFEQDLILQLRSIITRKNW